MKLLHELNTSQEKAAEREEKAAEREERKLDREIKLKELDIREKELAFSKKDLAEKAKIKPKVSLPKYTEGEDIEVFLRSFEKLAASYNWDKTEWAIRLVPQLTGKALEAYSRLSFSSSGDYDSVKQAILERYGLNALAYRDKFRYAKQSKGETFKEFAVRVEGYFTHRVLAEKVESNYKQLYDLLLREQLMFTASHDLQIWLRERNPHTFKELTDMADTYQLAHKQPNTTQLLQKETTVGLSMQANTGTLRANQGQGAIQRQPPDGVRRCYFCGSPDHLISN